MNFCSVSCWCCFRSSCFYLLYGKHQPPAFPRCWLKPAGWVAVGWSPPPIWGGDALNIQKNRMTRKTAIKLFVARFLLFPRFVAPIVCGKQTESGRASSLRKNSTLATPKARTAQFNVSRGTHPRSTWNSYHNNYYFTIIIIIYYVSLFPVLLICHNPRFVLTVRDYVSLFPVLLICHRVQNARRV